MAILPPNELKSPKIFLDNPIFSRIFYRDLTERQSMADDIWTIKELSAYLKLKEKTAYALVAKGEIPGFKVGGSWRFRQSDIDQWIDDKAKHSGGTGENDD